MKIVLAPMEGLVDDVMRDVLTRIGGIDWCVTEFIRVTNSLLPLKTFQRLAPELEHGSKTPAGTQVRLQLLGSEPNWLAENAVRAAELGAPVIDLNFGCPAPTVNRHRGGAVLLKEPETLHEIVQTVRQAVPGHIPVTAKMRLGYEDTSLTLDCARAIASAGAAELVVHARTKVEGYKPPAHWEWFARIQEVIDIPLIANGEVWTIADYLKIREVSGCDNIMIGRGLIAAPDFAWRIKHLHKTGEVAPVADWSQALSWVLQLLNQCHVRAETSNYPASRAKQWLKQLKISYPESEAFFIKIRYLKDFSELDQAIRAELRELGIFTNS